MSDRIQDENIKRQEENEQYTAKGAVDDIVQIGKDVKSIQKDGKEIAKKFKEKSEAKAKSKEAEAAQTPSKTIKPAEAVANPSAVQSAASGASAAGAEKTAAEITKKGTEKAVNEFAKDGTEKATQELANRIQDTAAETLKERAVEETGTKAAGEVASGTGSQAVGKAAGEVGSQAAGEAATQVASKAAETSVEMAADAGSQAAGQAAGQAAAQAGGEAAAQAGGAALSAGGAAATAGITLIIQVAVTAAIKIGKKVKEKLDEVGFDTEYGSKSIKRIGLLAWLGLHMLPAIIIGFIIFLIVHQDSKTYDTEALLESYIECAESVDGCEDFMDVDGEDVDGKGKRLIQMENGDWNPLVPDEVTDITNAYVKFIMKNSKDDEAVNFGFLDVGDDVTSELGTVDVSNISVNTEDEKKVFNFKRKTIKTYLMLSATAFNNVEWYIAGPKDDSEVDPAYVPQWTTGDNIREIKASATDPLFIYDLEEAKFHDIWTTMDDNHKTIRSFTDSDGNPFTAEIRTGLNIPEVEHYGITEELYLSILEPVLPAWIEPFSIYTATGDWELSQRVYDFYKEKLDDEPYEVCLYTIPTIEKERIYNAHTFETTEIKGYVQVYNEETGELEDDITQPIYETATYYGKLPTGVSPVAGEIYSIDDPEEVIEHVTCTYTAVLKKGYAYEFYVDTEWSIQPAGESIGEPIVSGGRAVANDIYNFYLQPEGEIEKKYTYINQHGDEKEVRNRLEWYIMTHYTESLKKRNELESLGDEDLLKAFEKEGICEDNTKISAGADPCGGKKHIEPFDYDIDALAYAIQRCDEYYKRVEKEVAYSADGVSSSYGTYLDYGGLASGTFGWPVPGSTKITSCFGQYESGGAHYGIDIANGGRARYNTFDIVASAAGKVKRVNNTCNDFNNYGSRCGYGWGNYVRIDHGNGYETIYAHLEKDTITVSQGQEVQAGTVLGKMGSSGNSTGIHLHFEMRKNGTRIDPTKGLMYGIPAGAANGKRCEDTVVYQDMPETPVGGSVSETTGSAAGSSTVQDIRSSYGALITKYASWYGLDPNLVVAMIAQESSGQLNADNGYAFGLMQWEYKANGTSITVKKADGTSETITGITKSNLRNNPDLQIHAGCAELKKKSDEFYGNTMVALQGYNYGSGGIRRCISYHIAGHANSDKRYCGVTQEVYKAYVISGDTGWMHDTKWYSATGCTEFGPRANTHGDPNYISNIMRYYDPNGL